MKFASIRLTTRDVPALAKFYENLTGIVPSTHPQFPGYAEIRFPSLTIALASEASAAKFNAGAAVGASNRSVILELEVDDVDAERTRLGGIVTDWVMQPTDMPWGNRSMLFRDPDGNLINVYKPVRRGS
jgi:predicted enzyme related to lactoylglutathione lyase